MRTSHKVIMLLFCISGIVWISISPAANTSDKKELNEVSKLKAENWQLKVGLTQCQQQLSTAQLGFDRDSLVKEFRKELDADDKQEFDWKTLTFKSSPAAPK